MPLALAAVSARVAKWRERDNPVDCQNANEIEPQRAPPSPHLLKKLFQIGEG